MSDTTIRFGKEEDQQALMAGLYPSADKEARVGAVSALGNLAQAAAQPDVLLDEEDLAELVVAALRLGIAVDDEDEEGLALLDALESLSDRLNENSEAVVAKVRAELAAFRFAALFWDEVCSGLEPLHPAPYAVREAAEAFLESLDVLSRSLIVIHRWIWRKNPRKNPTYQWLDDLRCGLEEAITDAIGRILNSKTRERLWPLHDRARELELGDLFPSLTALLAGKWNRLLACKDAGKMPAPQTESCALVAIGGTARSFEQLLKPVLSQSKGGDISSLGNQSEWADSLVMEIMRLAEQGHLSRSDMEAARKAVAEAPARWAAAHREALRRDGLKAPVFLVQNDQGLWTAPAVLRVTPQEVEQALRLRPSTPLRRASGQALTLPPGSSRAVLTDEGEGSSTPARLPWRASSLPVLPDDLPVEGFALASRDLHLDGVRILLFGDDRGLWCAVWGTQGEASPRCHGLEEVIYGNQVQIPLIQVGPVLSPVEGGGAGSRQVLGFRPGPLRRLLQFDRAYSPRAYVITVGESLLRSLLGWDFRECTERMNRAAWEARIHSYSELRSILLDTCEQGETLPSWIREIETTEEVSRKTGASTLGQRIDSGTVLLRDMGAEIDTLMSLPKGEMKPVDGDIFILIPTETATSILCALLIKRWLHERFPNSDDLRINPCDALRQREQLMRSDGCFERRHDLSMDTFYRMLSPLVDQLFIRDAADPVLVIPGGVKWEAFLMLGLGLVRRLACVYKFEPIGKEVKPVVFRWDALETGHRKDRPEPERNALPAGQPDLEIYETREVLEPTIEKPCLVINMGISLFTNYLSYCRENKLPRPERAEAEKLAEWVRETYPQEEMWRSCAELTGFEAWWRSIHREDSPVTVVLIHTASDVGRACREAVKNLLLKNWGADVLHRPEWEVLDLKDITGEEQLLNRQIEQGILKPFKRCLDELTRNNMQPDLLTMPGQTFTSALMLVYAEIEGYPVFLAPEAEKGEDPSMWWFRMSGDCDPSILIEQMEFVLDQEQKEGS